MSNTSVAKSLQKLSLITLRKLAWYLQGLLQGCQSSNINKKPSTVDILFSCLRSSDEDKFLIKLIINNMENKNPVQFDISFLNRAAQKGKDIF